MALSGSVRLALEFLALGVEALGCAGDEVAGGLCFALQFLDAALALRVEVHVAVNVLRLMRTDDLGGGLVQPIGPVGQPGGGAAALLAGIGGELDAVDGDHGLADQPDAVAGQQNLAEQGLHFVAEFAHELGTVGVAGLAVAADGGKQHVLMAGLLDLAAGDEAAAVGQQHDLEPDAWVVGAGAGGVVAKPGVERAQVEFVVNQVVECKLERAGLDLLGQHDGDEHPAAFDRLVARHLQTS